MHGYTSNRFHSSATIILFDEKCYPVKSAAVLGIIHFIPLIKKKLGNLANLGRIATYRNFIKKATLIPRENGDFIQNPRRTEMKLDSTITVINPYLAALSQIGSIHYQPVTR